VSAATQFGESFVGDGVNAAHINTVLGALGGPVETAWVTALATPRVGHAAFVVTAAPGLPLRPMTLFVNKATIDGDRHGVLTWGAAQAGVAGGVCDAVSTGHINPSEVDQVLLIVAVWVNPAADDGDAVYANNRTATAIALGNGSRGLPTLDAVLQASAAPWNAYFTARGDD
jgi:5,6,7,8-tetrahydromethanopterin hydro-lyase